MFNAILSALSFLKRVPFIGAAVDYIASNLSMVLRVALMSLALTLAGLYATEAMKTKSLEHARDELRSENLQLSTVVLSQQTAITQLQDLRRRDQETLTGLLEDDRAAEAEGVEAKAAVIELGDRNEDVEAYLESPIPHELACLLNDGKGCSSSGGAPAAAP